MKHSKDLDVLPWQLEAAMYMSILVNRLAVKEILPYAMYYKSDQRFVAQRKS